MNQVGEQLDALLDAFQGDAEAAAQALRERATGGMVSSSAQAPLSLQLQQKLEAKLSQVPVQQGAPIIQLENVTKRYKVGKQKVAALAGVSLTIYPGEFVAIIGPSGSGKSTLLQLVGCLDTPTTGTVTIDGKNTAKLSDGKLSLLRRATIGFIFQSFYLQPFLRLGDNVAVPSMFTSKKRRNIDADTAKLLETVGLSDRKSHFPSELSGGQIQRAAIARALSNQPKIILADEPTGNLDTANSEAIIDVFQTIRQQLGTTIVVVTHNPEIALKADRVIRLKDGVIA